MYIFNPVAVASAPPMEIEITSFSDPVVFVGDASSAVVPDIVTVANALAPLRMVATTLDAPVVFNEPLTLVTSKPYGKTNLAVSVPANAVISSEQAIIRASVFADVVSPASGRPVQLVNIPAEGVPMLGVVNVNPAMVVTVAPEAIDVLPIVGAEYVVTAPHELSPLRYVEELAVPVADNIGISTAPVAIVNDVEPVTSPV